MLASWGLFGPTGWEDVCEINGSIRVELLLGLVVPRILGLVSWGLVSWGGHLVDWRNASAGVGNVRGFELGVQWGKRWKDPRSAGDVNGTAGHGSCTVRLSGLDKSSILCKPDDVRLTPFVITTNVEDFIQLRRRRC